MRKLTKILLIFMVVISSIFLTKLDIYADEETGTDDPVNEESRTAVEEDFQDLIEVSEKGFEDEEDLKISETTVEAEEQNNNEIPASEEPAQEEVIQEDELEIEETALVQEEGSVPENGYAYAVLTGDGDFIFVRSRELYENGKTGTLTSISENTYTGMIFAGVESTPRSYTMPWSVYVNNIKNVYAVDTIAPESMYNWFYGCDNLKSFDSNNFDTSNTKTMIQMFMNCRNLTDVDLSHFDTINLTSMNGMFRSCEKLEKIDLSNFDTSKVENMEQLFYMCYKLKDLDIGSFDTANVKNMAAMFSRCKELTSLDLRHFDTSRVTYMADMFEECESLQDLDISSFNTSSVTGMTGMFSKCRSLTSLDLSHFDTSQLTGMNRMFELCTSLQTLNLSGWKNPKVTGMSNVFNGCSSLSDLILTDYHTDEVTDMSYMFAGFRSLGSLDLSGFDTSKVTNMAGMFYDNTSLKSLDLSRFDTANVTDMSFMFYKANALESVDLSGFDTSSVTNMNGMFGFCKALKELDLHHFDTSNVEVMTDMFSYCESLESLDVSHFDTSKITSMSAMFSDCPALKSLDLSSFDASKVTSMNWMFNKDSALTSIRFGKKFITSSLEEMFCMFNQNASLESMDLSGFDTSKVTSMGNLFNGCSSLRSVTFSEKWKKWSDDAFLPSGRWENDAKSLILSEKELYKQYPSMAEEFEGEWVKSNGVAVLLESGDLVFTRTLEDHLNGSYGTLKDKSGNEYKGHIFADVEASDNCADHTRWSSKKNQIRKVYAVDRIIPEIFDGWFMNCTNLVSFDGDNFDTSGVKRMDYMFDNCISLTEADVSGFDTANVIYMDYMFENTKIVTLDLSSFHTDSLMYSYCMFYGCSELTYLDLRNFDTSNAGITMHSMFNGCLKLDTVILSEKWTNWTSDCPLPGSTWTNGSLYLGPYQLCEQYPSHAKQWAGVWTLSDKGQYGDITDLSDRAYYDAYKPKGLWISELSDKEYTGKPILQEFRVYDQKVLLELNKDYTVKYSNNTKVGTASLTITGKGNYKGTLTKTFVIKEVPLDSSEIEVSLNKDLFKYKDGKAQKPSVSVYFNGKKLKAKTDYTISYLDASENKVEPISSGTYYVRVSGEGNFKDDLDKEFEILADGKTPVSDLTITLVKSKLPYDGSFQTPQYIIKDGKEVICDTAKSIHSPYLYPQPNLVTKIGPSEFKIIGNGDKYVGEVTIPFTITGTALSRAKISGFASSLPYTGAEVRQDGLILKNGSILLHEGEDYDYTASYENNVDAGTATIILTGKGGYTGTVRKTFKIKGTDFNTKNITVEGLDASYIYTGEEIEPAASLKHETGPLIEGVDYTVSFANNIKAGTATITYSGMGGYSGSFKKTFMITKAVIGQEDISMGVAYIYVKGGAKPLPTIKVNGKTLLLNTDYTLSYKNNTKLGTASLTVKGKGNYRGTVTKQFTVRKHYVNGLTMIAADKAASKKAAAMSTSIVISDFNGQKLIAGSDYDKNIAYTYAASAEVIDTSVKPNETITRPAGSRVEKTDIVPAGALIKASVTLKGNYGGTISETFRIVETDISKASVSIATQYYTGMAVRPDKEDIRVILNKIVLEAEDYEIVSYANNIAKGTATVTIKGVGIYGGNKTIKFTIAQRYLGITIRYNGNGASSGSMKDQLIVKDASLIRNTYKKTGYTFAYWSLEPGGTKAKTDGDEYVYDDKDAGKVITYYAIWVATE